MVFIFFQSLIVTFSFFLIFLALNKRFAWLKSFNFRWGGMVLIISFIFLFFLHPELEITKQFQALLIGLLAILVFGLKDDYSNLSWVVQFIFQLFLVVLLVVFGFRIDFITGIFGEVISLNFFSWHGVSLGSFVFLFFWVLGIMNAVNWFDGIDSSLGSVAIFAGLGLLFVSLLPEVNQPAIAIVSSIFLGNITAFMFFNLPPAKLIAGTSGSYFVGFFLAVLAVIAGNKIATLLIVLALPLLDLLAVVIVRLKNRQSIFQRDENHLHHLLLKSGWSEYQVFFLYSVFLGVVLFTFFLLQDRFWKVLLLFGEILFLSLMLVFIRFFKLSK